MPIRVEKVINNVPDPLDPDTLYAVRTGVGFDLRFSDSTGTTAHPLNDETGAAVLTDPVFTYNSDGSLALITYGDGTTKTFTYTSGVLTQLETQINGQTDIARRDFVYTGSILTEIIDSTFTPLTSQQTLVNAITAIGANISYYDLTDTSTMFQDIAGTVPVAANGDRIGHVTDLMGVSTPMQPHNNQLAQRPVWDSAQQGANFSNALGDLQDKHMSVLLGDDFFGTNGFFFAVKEGTNNTFDFPGNGGAGDLRFNPLLNIPSFESRFGYVDGQGPSSNPQELAGWVSATTGKYLVESWSSFFADESHVGPGTWSSGTPQGYLYQYDDFVYGFAMASNLTTQQALDLRAAVAAYQGITV